MVSGSLITRNYTDFRGVDFSNNEVSLVRSPDSLNMWKDYKKLGKCIETRPEMELVATYDNTVFGLFLISCVCIAIRCYRILYTLIKKVYNYFIIGIKLSNIILTVMNLLTVSKGNR